MNLIISWIKLNPCLAIFWKDVMYEIRSRDTLMSVLVFSLLVIVVFNFGISPNPKNVGVFAPGILWIAFIFGGVLGFTRTFAIERENEALNGLLLTPVSRDVIYFGKVLSTFTFMLVVEIITFPIFGLRSLFLVFTIAAALFIIAIDLIIIGPTKISPISKYLFDL